MRGWIAAIALGASCTGRAFVDDGGTSGSVDPESSGGAGSEGVVSVSASASVSVSATADDGVDDDAPSTTSGAEPECAEPTAPAIVVDVYPGEDPLEAAGGMVSRELDCVVADRDDGATVVLAFECDVSPTGYVGAFVLLQIDAAGVTIPVELGYGIDVHVRVQTFRDADLVDEFPWLRSDHLAIYRDDELLFGVGAGGWWPTTNDGSPDFWAPVHVETTWSSCDPVASECHEVTPGSLAVVLDEEKLVVPAYTLASIGAYDLHVGELSASDSARCGEPPYSWSSFAIAKRR
ncbi:MAG TPA: hypothetical protein VFG69_14740 [Nannocystaceae bacterium]|nr:hypothetical protein [Nannocystaceae bacterium]